MKFVAVALLSILFLFPLYWMFVGSFQTAVGMVKMPPEFFPYHPTLSNFKAISAGDYPLLLWLWNTVKITVVVMAASLMVNGMAAYAFALFKFRGAGFIQMAFLGSIMITKYAIMIPMFVLLRWYHLPQHLGVIIPSIFWPAGILVAAYYFRTIPASLYESARIDGAREMKILTHIVAPLCKPLIAYMMVTKGLEVMQDYFWQMLVLREVRLRTLLVGLIASIGDRLQTYAHYNDYGYQNAIGVVLFFPLLTIFLLANKYFVRGLTLGAVKE